jgi:hypothetical protein
MTVKWQALRAMLGDGGSVASTRSVVSVPVDEDLVPSVCICDGDDCGAEYVELVLGHDEAECTRELGAYELQQVKIVWTAVVTRETATTQAVEGKRPRESCYGNWT